MKFKCNICGGEFELNQMCPSFNGFGMVCLPCYGLDAKESAGDIIGHND